MQKSQKGFAGHADCNHIIHQDNISVGSVSWLPLKRRPLVLCEVTRKRICLIRLIRREEREKVP